MNMTCTYSPEWCRCFPKSKYASEGRIGQVKKVSRDGSIFHIAWPGRKTLDFLHKDFVKIIIDKPTEVLIEQLKASEIF